MLKSLLQFSEQLISPNRYLRKRYQTFLRLLTTDRNCHRLLASLEELYYAGSGVDICRVRQLTEELSGEVRDLLNCLHTLVPDRYANLDDYYKKFDFYVRFALAPPPTSSDPPYILSLQQPFADDRLSGGKGYHLSQLKNCLQFPIPEGFIIGTTGWHRLLEIHGARRDIDRLLAQVDLQKTETLHHCSTEITALLGNAALPDELADDINTALKQLQQRQPDASFAVRSSAVGEDAALSYAGLYRTCLNVSAEDVIAAYRKVLASKYSPEAICYRIINGIDDEATPMAVLVLAMIDATVSGVVTSSKPSTRDGTSTPLVHAVPGLGDKLMSGQSSPVTYRIRRSNTHSEIISCIDTTRPTTLLSDSQLLQLSQWAEQIVTFYDTPQDIEWSYGRDNTFYLLQARQRKREEESAAEDIVDLSGLHKIITAGQTASRGICSGPIHIFTQGEKADSIPDGCLLLCETTPPSLVSMIPNIGGVIARQGSVADHFSSVAREFALPVLVQLDNDFDLLTSLEHATLDATRKSVYDGTIDCKPNTTRSRVDNDTPLRCALKLVIQFVSPLRLVNPQATDFTPENCRSLHDIIRFCHEKSVAAMFFHSTDGLLRKPAAITLQTDIPLKIFVVDIGGGIAADIDPAKKTIGAVDVACAPLKALLRGLGHPDIIWHHRTHFDWQSYDSVALAGGIGSRDDSALASYCLISANYLNVNMRFGYHFTMLDCLCTKVPEENYILLRFSGGGGSLEGKANRLNFIAKVLGHLGFETYPAGDILDARFVRNDADRVLEAMDMVGRMLGTVKLLDMILGPEDDTDSMVDSFFTGTYDFSKE